MQATVVMGRQPPSLQQLTVNTNHTSAASFDFFFSSQFRVITIATQASNQRNTKTSSPPANVLKHDRADDQKSLCPRHRRPTAAITKREVWQCWLAHTVPLVQFFSDSMMQRGSFLVNIPCQLNRTSRLASMGPIGRIISAKVIQRS